jgi:hypothetical protein
MPNYLEHIRLLLTQLKILPNLKKHCGVAIATEDSSFPKLVLFMQTQTVTNYMFSLQSLSDEEDQVKKEHGTSQPFL